MPDYNLVIGLGYKGSGKPNAVPAYSDNGAHLLGGFMAADDAQTPYFGRLVSANPAGTPDGKFYCGIPGGYIPVGVLLYHAGIAMNDPAKPDSFITGQPVTIMHMGTLWIHTWSTTVVGSIAPKIGCVVTVNNTTGELVFMPQGSGAQPGHTVISGISVKSVSDDTSGALLFVNL